MSIFVSHPLFPGILRYKVDFQSMQLDELDNDGFDLEDY